jgi:hypothetical protein
LTTRKARHPIVHLWKLAPDRELRLAFGCCSKEGRNQMHLRRLTVLLVDGYSRSETAELAGVAPGDLDRLVDRGVISPDQEGRFTAGDARKAAFVATLLGAGLPFEALMSEIGSGRLSIEFIGHPLFADFSVLSKKTFEGLSTETGIPIDLLMVMREAIGSAVPSP